MAGLTLLAPPPPRCAMASLDFTTVYDSEISRVYGFFAYRVGVRADAEDLTQQTFERALRAWPRYDAGRASVTTWLMAIARNLMVDHLRARGRSRDTELLHDTEAASLVAFDAHTLGVDPRLERALLRLTPRARELIALRYGADLTGREIASLTGLTLANVQQILSRSLRQLKEDLDYAETVEVMA